MVVDGGGLMVPVGGGVDEPCARFDFFAGGSSRSLLVLLGSVGCDGALALFGTWMPSSDNDKDFRLVLYGMVLEDEL